MQHVCQHCGSSFERHLSPAHLKRNPPKYCSRSCRDAARRTLVELTCRQCGRTFRRKRYMADWSQERGPFCGFACYAAWQSQHTAGPANPNYQPDAWLDLNCGWCDAPISRRRLDHERNTATGLAFCGRDCFHEYARMYFPRQSYNWSSKRWRKARQSALDRDEHRCRECGSTDDLVVHHVRPFAEVVGTPDAHALDNLETLCRACHRVRHNLLRARPR